MSKPVVSVLVSSHNRLPLFRRSLWALANRPPKVAWELVVVDDESTEDVLTELKRFSSCFPWKFVRFDRAAFEKKTGLVKFHNNPAVTQNLAFRHSQGELVFQMGNEVIPWADCFHSMLCETAGEEGHFLCFSTTYDVPAQYLDLLDVYGTNLSQGVVDACGRWPLQSAHYRSDVTNYVSLVRRETWEAVGGFDERYYRGIAAEDSDFVRRLRALPGPARSTVSEAVSLHQSHNGMTRYGAPPASVITKERWAEGVRLNRETYDGWRAEDGPHNPQPWPWGEAPVKEVVTNQ